MAGRLNAHKVFRGTDQHGAYIRALKVSETQKTELREARESIRRALKVGFATPQIVRPRIRWIGGEPPSLVTRPLVPRFRMQGSAQYHTLNSPAHQPPQEIDFDDGMFLPISFISSRGFSHPALAAGSYFRIVEAILGPLCEEKKWNLCQEKQTCVRIELNDQSHIDLPLYAIPDADFVTLVEARVAKSLMAPLVDDNLILAEDVYRDLPQDKIMLANRSGEWTESDPRKIEDWFNRAVSHYGKSLRRTCRYLKGWRDHKWEAGGPSSITLMACVVKAFDDLGEVLPKNRDDLALQAVADRLPNFFRSPILNPVLPTQLLDEKWTREDRSAFVSAAENLKEEINAALNGTYEKSVALSHLRNSFGRRIPQDITLIDIDTGEREILSIEPTTVAAPVVHRTTSG